MKSTRLSKIKRTSFAMRKNIQHKIPRKNLGGERFTPMTVADQTRRKMSIEEVRARLMYES